MWIYHSVRGAVSRDTEACMQRIVAALPGFVPKRHVRSLKCLLAFGELDGERVCVKMLNHSDPVWAWYFERERDVLGRLPSSIRAPKLRALADGLMVVDELAGDPLTHHRRLERPLPRTVLSSCLELAARVQDLDLGEVEPPDESITRTLRQRLLEDPSSPLCWFHEGFDRCARLGIVSAQQVSFMHEALDVYPDVRCCHGDFLPRNLLVDQERLVSACDWECAGPHARDWDRALLWANSCELDREQIEELVARPIERARAFRALAGFALAREIKFANRASQARRDDLARQLCEILRPS
jgi:hypothetical protein